MGNHEEARRNEVILLSLLTFFKNFLFNFKAKI